MSQIQANETWHSPNEHVVTAREREYVAKLVETDARIGAEAAAKFGREVNPKRSIPVRLVRRALFEAKKLVGPFARKVQRAGLRQFNRRIADRKRIPNDSILEVQGTKFQVLALDGNSDRARRVVLASTADVFILTRTEKLLLRSAQDRIADAVRNSAAQMWFGDSRNVAGVREHRPVFNRLLLRQVDALGPVVIIRAPQLREVAATSVPAALWPLQLGLTIAEAQVELIPHVLGVGDATNIPEPPQQLEAKVLVEAELSRSSLEASVEILPLGRRRVAYALRQTPLVSIIIPTRGTGGGSEAFITQAVRSIISKSSYSNIELVVVADDPTPQPVVEAIDEIAGDKVRWVRWSEPFNFSSKMNLGAACATGEYLLFLNDDVEVVSSDWIERMLSLIGVDGIVYTGALLFFDDQTIQHAGHLYRGGAGHIGIGDAMRTKDLGQVYEADRIVSGVTAACSLIHLGQFETAGGFSQVFPGNYNDVDLALKLQLHGDRIAIAADARLYHFESKSRDASVHRSEIVLFDERWFQATRVDANWRRN